MLLAATRRSGMRLLLLAGTGDAHNIANALRREQGLSLTVSLARPQRNPKPFGWPVRIGGFGGPEAFANWIQASGVRAVIDATHPFATTMGKRAQALSNTLGIDYVRFLRPAWMPGPDDRWTFLNSAGDAATHIPKGATVFLATGQRDLGDFANLDGRRILCRVKDTPEQTFPFSDGRFIVQSGPFSVHGECDFFLREEVDWIVTRNSGGQGSWPKLEAARELGLPVAMIRRPPQPEALRINTVTEAILWVRRRLERWAGS